jgi:DNA-binding response OmpR family regulator
MGAKQAGPKVLVADDDAKIRWLMELNLTRAGYQVLLAEDGAQALELADREQPDLAVLDVMMPEKDGLTVCEELKRRWPETKVLILTVKGTDEDLMRARKAGADEYMLKPYSLAELLEALRSLQPQPTN